MEDIQSRSPLTISQTTKMNGSEYLKLAEELKIVRDNIVLSLQADYSLWELQEDLEISNSNHCRTIELSIGIFMSTQNIQSYSLVTSFIANLIFCIKIGISMMNILS